MDPTSIPVLIVDDDPAVAALLRQLLRNIGSGFSCTANWVATGAAARAEFAKGTYRLVLLDYMLPDDDGLKLLEAVQALPAEQRPVVIMLTGEGNEQVAVEAMKHGARDYLVKSAVNLPALRRSILSALEHHRLEEKLARSTEELRRTHARLEADLAMAREVQQALLPQGYPVLPAGRTDGGRLRFAHRWIPSHEVAGDYFTVFPVSATAAGVFLCDVMGHGVRAALITALLRGLLREHLALASSPGPYLGLINRGLKGLLERAGDLVFATAAYLVVDAVSGQVQLAVAGHPAPLLLRRGARRVEPMARMEETGPALGLVPDVEFEVCTARLEPGDAVLLYTDGIYEVEGPDGEEFGRRRLHMVVDEELGLPSDKLLDRLLLTVRQFHVNGPAQTLPDDVCLLAVDLQG
jgi:serine phosphatase RsbU (regulator of sigma subunit)